MLDIEYTKMGIRTRVEAALAKAERGEYWGAVDFLELSAADLKILAEIQDEEKQLTMKAETKKHLELNALRLATEGVPTINIYGDFTLTVNTETIFERNGGQISTGMYLVDSSGQAAILFRKKKAEFVELARILLKKEDNVISNDGFNENS